MRIRGSDAVLIGFPILVHGSILAAHGNMARYLLRGRARFCSSAAWRAVVHVSQSRQCSNGDILGFVPIRGVAGGPIIHARPANSGGLIERAIDNGTPQN